MDEVVGVDEVGRGSWAGPLLVVAARAISALPGGVTDSKLLSRRRRGELFDKIILCCQIGEGWVQPEEIDAHGLAKAMRIGVSRALIMLGPAPDNPIIMDGKVNYCPSEFTEVQCHVNADKKYPAVSAASIYAKVTRDRYMARIAQIYPAYQFQKHVGYGTKLHAQLLTKHGPCAIHRKSFRPIQLLV